LLRNADNNVNYQLRAKEFSVGDRVVPFGMFSDQAGRVTAVWLGIGMVDVEMPNGNKRYPVEDLQRFDKNNDVEPPGTVSTPGGQGSVPVTASSSRVAQAHAKKALYWTQRDRQYRMSGPEAREGKPTCPRCGPDHGLQKAIYKRRDGSSERLMGCPGCMFLIKDADIVNFGPVVADEIEIEGQD
jgi:hypothetical protein